MRYSEKKYNKKTSNPIQFIIFTVFIILTSPIRFFSEIAKKIIFMGEYGEKVFKVSIGVSGGSTLLLVIHDIFLYRGICLYGKVITVTSFFFCTVILIGLNVVYKKYKVNVNLTDTDEEDENIQSVEKKGKDKVVDSKPSIDLEEEEEDDKPLKPTSTKPIVDYRRSIEDIINNINNNSSSYATKELEDRDKEVTMTDFDHVVDNIPKEKIDPIFEIDKDIQIQKGLDILKEDKETNEVEDLEYDEILRKQKERFNEFFTKAKNIDKNLDNSIINSNKEIDDTLKSREDNSEYLDLF